MKKSKDKTKNLWAQTSAHIKSMFIYVQKKKKKKKNSSKKFGWASVTVF